METLESTNSKLRIELVKQAIKCELPFWEYKLLAEWLGCYQYVLPADRHLSFALASSILTEVFIKEPVKFSALTVFKSAMLCDLIESTLTEQEQKELMPWMNV